MGGRGGRSRFVTRCWTLRIVFSFSFDSILIPIIVTAAKQSASGPLEVVAAERVGAAAAARWRAAAVAVPGSGVTDTLLLLLRVVVVPVRSQQQLQVDLHLLNLVAIGSKYPLPDVQRLPEGALGVPGVVSAKAALLVAVAADGQVHQADADAVEGGGARGRILPVQLAVVDEGAVVRLEGQGPLTIFYMDGSCPGVEEGHLGRGGRKWRLRL